MDFLQGNTYLLASKFYDEKTNQEIDGNRVVKAEFAFNDIVLMYGTEDPRVTYDPDSNTFLLALTEEETLSLKGSVRYQAKALLDNGTVSGSKAACSYVYDTICRTVLGDGEISPSADSQIVRFDLIDARELGTKNYEELENKPSINGTVLIGDITIDADFVNALPDNTKYAASFTISLDTTNYQLTIQLKDQDGNNIGTSQTVDLPSENAIVDASYDETTKKITFVLQSGNTFEVDVSSIVSGLIPDSRTIAGLRLNQDISASALRTAINVDDGADSFNEDNIIAGDNVTITKSGKNVTISSTGGGSGASAFDELSGSPYDNTNLANALNSKQDTISDLETIRSGASAGATAVQPNANISVLVNDAGFITASVNNLTNYYLKSETYTQAEVNALIGAIKTIKYEIVAELPTASATTYFNDSKTIYLVAITGSGNDYYNEYITVRSGTEGSYAYDWEKIGNTQIDLSGYVQKVSHQSFDQLIYQNSSDNSLGIRFTPSNTQFSIPQRDSNGTFMIGSPVNSNDAANKNYVDTKVEALTGSSAPTTSTVADFVGQPYLDTTNNKTYQCTAITEDTSTTPSTFTYTWTQMIRATDTAGQYKPGVVMLADAAGGFVYNQYVGLMLNEPTLSEIQQPRGGPANQKTILLQDIPTAVKYALCGPDRIGYYGDVQNTGSETNKKSISMTSAEQTKAKSVLGITDVEYGLLRWDE